MPFLEDFSPPTATPQPGNSQDSTSGTDQSVSPTSTDHLQGPDTGVTVLQHIGGPYRRGSEDHVAVTFSPFLETDFLSSIPSEDFKYLQHTACLQIPQRNNCDELVRAYFLYVHPHLPLIDEGKFWDTYRSSQSSEPSASRMSLFVFRAMLLVACSFVPSSTIKSLGFRNTRTARRAYYRRAKALYDFGVERSNLAKAQGAVLMTFHVPLSEPNVNSHWLGIAINHAKAEDADRYFIYSAQDPMRHNQLKRLWWCCIIRDRTLSVGLRRPITIFSTSFDYVWPPLTEDDLMTEVGRSHLCAVLTDILLLLYPADGILVKGDRLDLMIRIYKYTDNLNEWHEAMESNVELAHQSDKALCVVTLFTNLLNIVFQSAKAALCNYRIMLTVKNTAQYCFERLQTKNELQASLRSIAQSLRAIIDAEMITYSPISMVAFLALPSICYNLDRNDRASTQKAIHNPSGNVYKDFLRELQLKYEGTDRTLNDMSKLMSEMDLEDATSPSTARSESEHGPATNRGNPLARPSEASIPPKSGAGIDIVVSYPQKYLQISYMLDFFLSRGRFPTKCDRPADILPQSLGSIEGSLSAGLMNGMSAPEMGCAAASLQQSQSSFSDFSSQNIIAKSAWISSSIGSSDLTTSGEVGTRSVDLSSMLMGDPFGEAAASPDDLSLKDFMTDRLYSGIERMQNMLYTYPD